MIKVGDTFELNNKSNKLTEIISICYDNKHNKIIFIGERLNGEYEGYIDIYYKEDIFNN